MSTDGIAGTQEGGNTSLDPNAPPPAEGVTVPPEQTPPGEQPTTPTTGLSACTRAIPVPTLDELQSNPRMPDPFRFFDGTPVLSTEDWVCRQKEIRQMAEAFVYGTKPGPPDSLQATFNNGTLDITATRAGQTTQFSVSIATPNGAGPFPGVFSVFSFGGPNALTPQGVATLDINDALTQIAESTGSSGRQNPPQGDFYRLYPELQSTGSLMAWAWTASRIVDALELTTGHNVDTTKLSALGCSRDGKAAATIALFDERFALVAAASPGSGTTSGWRVAQAVFTGNNPQTASQIWEEDTWIGANFRPFAPAQSQSTQARLAAIQNLPIDQHLVLALAWPRPLIMMEGINDPWNCPDCSFQTMSYTKVVYDALGTSDRIGFPQPNHGHCGQDGTFAEEFYNAFVDRFLRGDESVSTADRFDTDANFTFDANQWQDGDIPTIQ